MCCSSLSLLVLCMELTINHWTWASQSALLSCLKDWMCCFVCKVAVKVGEIRSWGRALAAHKANHQSLLCFTTHFSSPHGEVRYTWRLLGGRFNLSHKDNWISGSVIFSFVVLCYSPVELMQQVGKRENSGVRKAAKQQLLFLKERWIMAPECMLSKVLKMINALFWPLNIAIKFVLWQHGYPIVEIYWYVAPFAWI